jgi:hypothetical protein
VTRIGEIGATLAATIHRNMAFVYLWYHTNCVIKSNISGTRTCTYQFSLRHPPVGGWVLPHARWAPRKQKMAFRPNRNTSLLHTQISTSTYTCSIVHVYTAMWGTNTGKEFCKKDAKK